MIVETAIGIVILGGGILGLKKISTHSRQQKLALETSKADELKRSLLGIRGGVWIREPNGSEHVIQNRVEQELTRRSLALFNLRNEAVQALVKEGTWNQEIASSNLDVAVIGRIKVSEWEEDEWEYITVRHVDTETGRRFDALDCDHPGYREPNSLYDTTNVASTIFGSNRFYYEPREEFGRRQEIEKRVIRGRKHRCLTLDVRFYGPEGKICGGCVAESSGNDGDPIGTLVSKLVSDLIAAIKPSIDAHDRILALTELDQP